MKSGNRLSREASITLINHGIFQFGTALSAIFINLYLWRLTNDLWINGMFNLITLLSAPIATVVAGRMAKRMDRLIAYRTGIYLTALFYLCILIVQEQMVEYYAAFALLKGISTAFYWLGQFAMIYDVSDDSTRHRYLGWNLVINNSALLAGPAVAGVLIERWQGMQGYTMVYMLTFIMFAAASVVSLWIPKRPTHHKTYLLKYAPALIRKAPSYGRSLLGWFIVGLPQGIMAYIPAILLYQAVSRESFVGYVNVCIQALSVLSGYLLTRWAREGMTRPYLLISAWGTALCSIPLLFSLNLWTVVLFMAAFAMLKPLQTNAFTAYYYNQTDRLPLKRHFRIESVVMREGAINLGRSAGVVLFMICSGQVDSRWLPLILVLVMASQIGIERLVVTTAQPRRAAA